MEQAELREYKDILAQAVEIGKYLLSSGAEVSRVEDTIERILHAYGAAQVDVFALQSLILASVKLSDGSECIRARRVVNTGTNLRQLEDLNQLAREICANRPTAAEIEVRLKDILARKSNPLLTLAGYLMAVFTMAVSLASMFLFRVCFSYVLSCSWGMDLGLLGVWIAMIIDWWVRALYFVLRFALGKWKQINLI